RRNPMFSYSARSTLREERRHLAVFTAPDGYGFHVVVKNTLGHTLKVIERVDVAALQDGLMRFPHELDVEHAGPAEHHGKAPQVTLHSPQVEATIVAAVDLGFLARFRLVANRELTFALGPQRLHEVLQDGVTSLVALTPNLTQNDLSVRDAILDDAALDVLLVRVQLRHSFRRCI